MKELGSGPLTGNYKVLTVLGSQVIVTEISPLIGEMPPKAPEGS